MSAPESYNAGISLLPIFTSTYGLDGFPSRATCVSAKVNIDVMASEILLVRRFPVDWELSPISLKQP
jgi:hypothetical protein